MNSSRGTPLKPWERKNGAPGGVPSSSQLRTRPVNNTNTTANNSSSVAAPTAAASTAQTLSTTAPTGSVNNSMSQYGNTGMNSGYGMSGYGGGVGYNGMSRYGGGYGGYGSSYGGGYGSSYGGGYGSYGGGYGSSYGMGGYGGMYGGMGGGMMGGGPMQPGGGPMGWIANFSNIVASIGQITQVLGMNAESLQFCFGSVINLLEKVSFMFGSAAESLLPRPVFPPGHPRHGEPPETEEEVKSRIRRVRVVKALLLLVVFYFLNKKIRRFFQPTLAKSMKTNTAIKSNQPLRSNKELMNSIFSENQVNSSAVRNRSLDQYY